MKNPPFVPHTEGGIFLQDPGLANPLPHGSVIYHFQGPNKTRGLGGHYLCLRDSLFFPTLAIWSKMVQPLYSLGSQLTYTAGSSKQRFI